MENLKQSLDEILKTIDKTGVLDEKAEKAAAERQKVLAKPTGALGALEDIAVRMAGITGKVKNYPGKKGIIIIGKF